MAPSEIPIWCMLCLDRIPARKPSGVIPGIIRLIAPPFPAKSAFRPIDRLHREMDV